MSEKAPMPPWWVEKIDPDDGWPPLYFVLGGRPDDPVTICFFNEGEYSNAKELADLIVQRTKQ